MKSDLRFGFTLGEFRISPLLGTVSGPSGERHIPPKVVDVLLCLAEADGEVVERDDLMRAVWGEADGHDTALSHCISELRHALDDHAADPAYIQTVPKRGYRLLAGVVPDRADNSADSDRADDPAPRSRNPLEALWQELRERNVMRVAIAYAAVSWLLLQVADVVFDALKLPDFALPVFLFLLGVGFLIAVIVAWLFQVVPEHEAELGQRRLFKSVVDVSVITVLAIAVGLLAYRQFIQPPMFADVAELPDSLVSPAAPPKSIAVLRFANFGGDATFSNGLSEHLLNLLARTGDLKVPSRQVTWMLSDQNIDPRIIATTLRVRYLLEGSVQQKSRRIRVTAQLIDGASGDHVWSESYDETLSAENFFNIQDAIASQVVDKLAATVSDDELPRPAGVGTASDDALRHYLEGREALNQPKVNASMAAAVAAFEAAIAADPHYAAAFAGLCEAHLAWYVTYLDKEYFDAAESACIRALRIDPELGEVHAALGSLYRYAGQYDEAEARLVEAAALLHEPAFVLEELGRTYRAQNKLVLAEQTFKQAIMQEPANWSVYKSMGNFLFRVGRYEDALPYYKQVTVMQRDSGVAFQNIGAAFFMLGDFDNASVAWRRSLELDPTHVAYMNLGNSYYYQGRFERSVEAYREAIEIGASDARAWGSLAASCAEAGDEQCAADAYAEAIRLLEESLGINPEDTAVLSRLAAYLARTGRPGEAQEILGRLEHLEWSDPDVLYFVAQARIALGEPDAALETLEQAVLMGYPRTLVAGDPSFSAIKKRPEFIRMTQNLLD